MAYLLLLLSALFWSGNFVLSRGMHADIPPLSLSFWRWTVALLILLCFSMRHLWGQKQIVRKHIRFIAVQGLLGVAGFNSLIYIAVQTTTAINAVLVNSCIPVLIAVFSWILYKEMMTLRQCLGVLVSLCGVLLIIARGELAHLMAMSFNQGDLLVLIAAAIWALYSANLRKYPKELHPLAYLSGIIISGLLVIFPFYLMEMSSGKSMIITASSVVTVLYVAIFASLLAFIFWNRAVRSVGANKAGPFIHLMPVFSTLLAVIFLDETIHAYHIKGILLIFFGILMTTFMITKK
ncbi:MAG: multidrug transporter [Desulfobulbaceae bacterium S5133MH15]|nr:MAG: multidrug transporter [Desulfobulbaceae bacterium S5133MH15]OEU82153.1 MAG: multidrug transporter [Desulfobulbaceae bacterium C00003063]